MKNKQIVFNLHTSAMTCGELRIWASRDTQFMLSDQRVKKVKIAASMLRR